MLNDVGVLPDSVRYYHEPDAFTEACLYYAPHGGVYHCNEHYLVRRDPEDCLEVCQVIIVDEGALTFTYRGQTQTAPAGAILLLDCREPHRYFSASDNLRMRWFHVTGSSSQAYTQHIIKAHGAVLHMVKSAQLEICCAEILQHLAQERLDPQSLSLKLHDLLSLLMRLAQQPEKSPLEKSIQASAAYIEAHYAEKDVDIQTLARHAALSACYYLRKFKEFQGVTPHQYLQAVRLRVAKQQLSTTSHSIEEIAASCGFCNTSHFVMTFRKNTGMTPLQFRTMWK